MENAQSFYINGTWTAPLAGTPFTVIDPSTEEAIETIHLGGQADTDAAVAAAKAAFPAWRDVAHDQQGGAFGPLAKYPHGLYPTRR